MAIYRLLDLEWRDFPLSLKLVQSSASQGFHRGKSEHLHQKKRSSVIWNKK